MSPSIDPLTARTAEVFLERVASRYPVSRAILFGSRARHDNTEDSDADIAVILSDAQDKRNRVDITLDMTGTAFDVMLETGIRVGVLALWEVEIEHPESFSNPALIENIRREGIPI